MQSHRTGCSQGTAPHKHPGLQRPGPVLAARAVGSVAKNAGHRHVWAWIMRSGTWQDENRGERSFEATAEQSR